MSVPEKVHPIDYYLAESIKRPLTLDEAYEIAEYINDLDMIVYDARCLIEEVEDEVSQGVEHRVTEFREWKILVESLREFDRKNAEN